MTRERWSDERLHDAYAALVARPTPPGLQEDVMADLRDGPVRASRGRWRPAALLPAAAALTAVVVVSVALLSGSTAPSASPPAGSAGPSPSRAVASATPAESPSPGGSPAVVFPSEVLGLPVITVSRMLELTDEGTHDGEVLAVGGWYAPPLIVWCPNDDRYAPRPLLEISCLEDTAWLADRPQQPAAKLVPKFIVGSTRPPGPDVDLPVDRASMSVVFLGHVGDQRASLCPAVTRATCERTFVVDRVAWANGKDVPLQLYHDVTLAGRSQPSLGDAQALVEATLPRATILSVAYLAGETVRRIEPLSGYQGDGALYVVRVIGPRPCGPLLGDGTYGWSDPLLFTLAGEPVPHPQGPCVVKPL